jgi:hypothetical protein
MKHWKHEIMDSPGWDNLLILDSFYCIVKSHVSKSLIMLKRRIK